MTDDDRGTAVAAAAGGGTVPGWDCHVHVFDAASPVATGHYRPAHRPLAQIEAAAVAAGVQHLVLVQPSVYGHDNTLLLQALAARPGRHRGVVVLGNEVDDHELDAMHALGVRGVRLNLVSPVGESGADVGRRFAALAPRLRARGWHLQWYAGPEHLAAAQDAVRAVNATPEVMGYIVDLVRATRAAPSLSLGVSPRGATALLATARASALTSSGVT